MRRGALLLIGLSLVLSSCAGSPPAPSSPGSPSAPASAPPGGPAQAPEPPEPVTTVQPTQTALVRSIQINGSPVEGDSIAVPQFTVLSPDRRQALIYGGDPYFHPTVPFLYDLATGARQVLNGAPADPLFCWAGWGPDGSLLLLAFDALWRAEGDRLVRWQSFAARGCRLAERSPDGRYLASWAPLRLIDLQTGDVVTVERRFDPIAQDGGVAPRWSPAGDQVGLGHAAESGIGGGPIETVILDRTGQIMRQIPGWWPLAWLPDGDLVVNRPLLDEKTERARLAREGQPSSRPAPPDGQLGPDGRWVIPWAPGTTRQVIELATGRIAVLPESSYVQWLPDSTLLLVQR